MMFFDTVECPYCKYENDMSDGCVDLLDDNKFDHECENCGEEFEVEVEFEPIYSANKIVYDTCEYYKKNPIKFCEDYLGIELSKFQKIKLKIYDIFIFHLQELIKRQKEIMYEMSIEPYGSLRYEVLKLHIY